MNLLISSEALTCYLSKPNIFNYSVVMRYLIVCIFVGPRANYRHYRVDTHYKKLRPL